MQPVNNQPVVVSLDFKDGRRLFGIWTPWLSSLAAPLFRDLAGAQRHLDCGISRLVNIEKAIQSSDDVEVRLLGESEPGKVVLTTQASWSEAYVTGACEAKLTAVD